MNPAASAGSPAAPDGPNPVVTVSATPPGLSAPSGPAAPRAFRGDGEAILRDLPAAFATGPPALVLVFAADGAAVPPLTRALSDRFGPGCRVVGCSSAGSFAFGRWQDEEAVAVAFPAEGFEARALWLSSLQQHATLDWMVGLRALASDLPERPGHTRFGLLFVDGLSGQEELVAAVVDSTLPGLLVLGGSVADGLRFGRTHLALDGEMRGGSAVFCLVSTPGRIEEVVFDHFSADGPQMVVTDAVPEERLLLEINGEPAAEEYARLIGIPVAELGPAVFAEHPLLVRIGGRNFVRAIRSVSDGGGLKLMSLLETGTVLTLGHTLNPTAGLEARLSALPGRADLVLGFDCILRRLALERAGLAGVAERIFETFHVAGFNTYGEQHGGIHVNQTFVGLAFLGEEAEGRPAGSGGGPGPRDAA